jgi:MOSC domain-containing protein YiiM
MPNRTFDELEALYTAGAPEPRDAGTVRLVCVRVGGGEHRTPERVAVTVAGGVEGDRWALDPERDTGEQVTLMSARVAKLIAADHAPLHAAGDNFLVELDLSVEALPVGTRLRLGTAELEISEIPHTGCRKYAARFGHDALKWANHVSTRGRRLRGVNARVVADGLVAVGDAIEVLRGPTIR